jgi:integrase
VKRFLEKEWLPVIQPTVRRTTFLGYEGHVRNHIVPALGNKSLRSIDGRILNTFYASLADGTKNLAPSSVKRVHATIHRALYDAVRWGFLEANPADACDPPKDRGRNTEMQTWSAQQLATFLKSVRSHRHYPMWVLLAMTGMRRGEALGLRWCDVDLAGSSLSVRQTLIAAGGDVHIAPPKTARGRRVIALDARTVQTLKEHRQKQKPSDLQRLLFTDERGAHLIPQEISKEFGRLRHAARLPRIRLHDLRHTHATLALQAGIHPKIVSERLGHSTISLTLDVYSHALPHMQQEASERIGRLIFG